MTDALRFTDGLTWIGGGRGHSARRGHSGGRLGLVCRRIRWSDRGCRLDVGRFGRGRIGLLPERRGIGERKRKETDRN